MQLRALSPLAGMLSTAFSFIDAASASESTPTTINSGSYVQALLALLLILSILAATAWFARKLTGGKGFGQGGMKVLGGIVLSPKERIVLVEVSDQWLVIGIVPGQIRTLHRMPKQPSTEDGAAPQTPGEKPFSQWLNSMTGRRSHD